MDLGIQSYMDTVCLRFWYVRLSVVYHVRYLDSGFLCHARRNYKGEYVMGNKFFSFEMVFVNGHKYMGNMVLPYGDILSEYDVSDVENIIRTNLNQGGDIVGMIDIVTLTNWKTL